MTAENAAGLPVFLITTPREIVVEMQGARVPGRLSSRQPTGGVVAADLSPHMGALLLCHLYRDGYRKPTLSIEGLVMGAAAASFDARAVTGFVVRWNWAYAAKGEDALRRSLKELLAYPASRLRDKTVVTVNEGAIFAFRSQPRDRLEWLVRRMQERSLPTNDSDGAIEIRGAHRPAEPLARMREHERIPVDVPCRFGTNGSGSGAVEGRIYNVGREGVFITTQEMLPDEGDPIQIRIVMRHDDERCLIKLNGIVRWPMQRCDMLRGGGFGVHVRSIADGRGGRVFHAFLDRVIARRFDGTKSLGETWEAPPAHSDPTRFTLGPWR